jgi:hypothetical protein
MDEVSKVATEIWSKYIQKSSCICEIKIFVCTASCICSAKQYESEWTTARDEIMGALQHHLCLQNNKYFLNYTTSLNMPHFIRLNALTVVKMSMYVFWVVTPWRWGRNAPLKRWYMSTSAQGVKIQNNIEKIYFLGILTKANKKCILFDTVLQKYTSHYILLAYRLLRSGVDASVWINVLVTGCDVLQGKLANHCVSVYRDRRNGNSAPLVTC